MTKICWFCGEDAVETVVHPGGSTHQMCTKCGLYQNREFALAFVAKKAFDRAGILDPTSGDAKYRPHILVYAEALPPVAQLVRYISRMGDEANVHGAFVAGYREALALMKNRGAPKSVIDFIVFRFDLEEE